VLSGQFFVNTTEELIVTFGLFQLDSQWEDRASTRERIEKGLASWSGKVDCIVFPEMTLSGFSMKPESATLDGEDHEFFRKLADSLGISLLYGGVEDGFNCIFCAKNGNRQKTVYRKRHLFTFGGEKKCYSAGSEAAIIDINGARFGLAICYDLRFPYHFWENAKNCDGYIIIANWPEGRREHWLALLRARAIENQAFVLGVNRIGQDSGLAYSGDSSIFSPFGERLLDCGSGEGIFKCEIDPGETRVIREKFRFLEDRQK
jgi:predicted amidohydrolase